MRRAIWLGALLAARGAWGGGFEVPANGTEALGRGGAFVAKADNGTALEYNIAGLARQRGTRVTLDSNLLFHGTAFTRAGLYPGDPGDPSTPWAGKPYPTMRDGESIFYVPFLGVSTDLGGRLEKWTIGVGLYGPSSIGRHNFGVAARAPGMTDDPPATTKLDGRDAPAPSRYDVTKTDLLLAYPTLAVAWQPHKVIALGAAWQVVLAEFDLANANLTPVPGCPQPDHPDCDSYGRLKTFGTSFSSSSAPFTASAGQFSPGISSFGWLFSVMLHPVDWLDLGATLRPQIDVRTEGKLHAVAAPALKTNIADAPVTFAATLPTWLRLGGRLVARYPDGSERADVELNLVWENWSAERASRIHAEEFFLGPGGQLDADVLHNYRDTFGIRAGAAYNARLTEALRATLRVGSFFDSAATQSKNTRLDFNTAAKFGLTCGFGLTWRGMTLNLAYAYVHSPARDVADSETLGISAVNGTRYSEKDALIAVGNGRYEHSLQIVSVGLTVNFSALRRPRP